MMEQYLEFCVWVSPYVVYTFGLVAILFVTGCLLYLGAGIWWLALAAYVDRMKKTVMNTKTYLEFREYKRAKKGIHFID